MDAEMAHRFLTPNEELQEPVREELNVNGSILTVLVLERSRERVVAGDQGQGQFRRSCNGDKGNRKGVSRRKECGALGSLLCEGAERGMCPTCPLT